MPESFEDESFRRVSKNVSRVIKGGLQDDRNGPFRMGSGFTARSGEHRTGLRRIAGKSTKVGS
jgi:hypothetical protein